MCVRVSSSLCFLGRFDTKKSSVVYLSYSRTTLFRFYVSICHAELQVKARQGKLACKPSFPCLLFRALIDRGWKYTQIEGEGSNPKNKSISICSFESHYMEQSSQVKVRSCLLGNLVVLSRFQDGEEQVLLAIGVMLRIIVRSVLTAWLGSTFQSYGGCCRASCLVYLG